MGGEKRYHIVGRRDLLLGAGVFLTGCRSSCTRAPEDKSGGTPEPAWGVQSGDVTESSAVIWCRSDRPARLVVEWSSSPAFASAETRRIVGPIATTDTALTARVLLGDLPRESRVHYRARFEGEKASEWLSGTLLTAPTSPRDVVFAWSGDTNGQGWGIDPSRGGMPAYAAVLAHTPEFFIHCGDTIYADDPIRPEIRLDDGTIWRNVVTEAKSHVAETLDDFRGAQLYARHSAEVRALSAAAPLFAIWDDHEVHDDWYPGEILDEPFRKEQRIDVLSPLARRAFHEHQPTLREPTAAMYRKTRWGPHLDLFFVDGRAYRTANFPRAAEEHFFGATQLAWLTDALARSTATWKVVACDMPLGLVIGEPMKGGNWEVDAFGRSDGPPEGREVEIAALLRTLKARRVKNLVFLTADVHYAAAHRYSPERAEFTEMDPFWEFVAGPMHAASFPRKPLDDTFGPELVYASSGPDTWGSPATSQQFFGVVRIEGSSGIMSVALVDARGTTLHTSILHPDV